MAGQQRATFGGGCFWCLEPIFEQLRGVEKVESGYAGGRTANPTYEQVCSDTTGHAEVVQITFDPAQITFRELMEVFFAMHDPTTLNRQGGDTGTQYRSAVFPHDDGQRREAESFIQELNEASQGERPVVTSVESMDHFYRAEDYHQDYFRNNPGNPYCQVVIPPKIAKLLKTFGDRVKTA